MNWPVINDNETDRLPRGISNRLTTVKEMDQFHRSEPDYEEDMIGADFHVNVNHCDEQGRYQQDCLVMMDT